MIVPAGISLRTVLRPEQVEDPLPLVGLGHELRRTDLQSTGKEKFGRPTSKDLDGPVRRPLPCDQIDRLGIFRESEWNRPTTGGEQKVRGRLRRHRSPPGPFP